MPETSSRRVHAEGLLTSCLDAWVATSSKSGPHLVPLSFAWHDERLLLVTSAASRTGKNLLENAVARVAVGSTRDLVVMVGSVRPLTLDETDAAEAFAARVGFGSADLGTDGTLFALTPDEIQVWVDRADADRRIMRNGRWV